MTTTLSEVHGQFLLISFLALFPAMAGAQASVPGSIALPGSANASFGTVGPLEPGNVVGNAVVEQGITVWRHGPVFAVGFVDVTARADSKGYGWNNNSPYLVGGKVVVAGSAGVFQVVVGAAGDLRHDTTDVTPAGNVSYWAGWRRTAGELRLPGSVWAVSGVTAANEPDNWITSARVEQGVVAKRFGQVSLVPFAAAAAGFDTRNYVWNNRAFIDTGVKVTTRLRGAAVDVGVAQRMTREWQSGDSDAAPVVFLNVWLGWMPRINR